MSTLNPIPSLLGLKNTTTRSARGAHFTTPHLQLHASAELRPQLHFSERNPVTKGALQSKTAAPYAAFLAKISPDGRTLAFSTYLGGSTGDAAFAIAVDGSGNAYLTGNSGSADFPVTSGAFQSANKDKCTWKAAVSPVGDAFVSKIASDGGSLLYSTLLGGSCGDEGLGIAVDNSGIATVVGLTESADFPVTRGSFRASWPGVDSGFVARLSPQGSSLLQASFVGGTYSTTADAVALDSKGNLYITGCSEGFDADYYGLGGVFMSFGAGGPGLAQAGFSGSCTGVAYVLKLDSAASSKAYLSYINGPIGEASNIAVDAAGRAWIAGSEEPMGFLVPDFQTVHPFQTRMGQGFVAEWSADGATLLFSSRADSAYGMAMDGSGNVFLTGFTNAADKIYNPSALLARIDGSVPSPITVENPQQITPGPWELMSPGQTVGPSEILAIPGSGMGPAQQAGAQIGSDGRMATTLAGTSVTFDGTPAPLISVQSDRIVCMVPFEISSPTTMQVHSNGADSNSIRMPFGYVVDALAIANADGTANTPDWPAEILFAGPAPGQLAGISQINFRVPQLGAGAYTATVGLDPIVQGQGPYDDITLNVGQR